MKPEKVLITGGAGFLGTHIVSYLQRTKKYNITVFDKLENHTIKDDGINYFQGNISSEKDIQAAFEKYGPFTTVYHLASAMPNKEVPDNVLWETNITGTRNIVTAAVKNKAESIVFTSSNVAYGIPKSLPTKEDMELTPLEIYGKSKAKAEKELEKFKKDINIQIIRCPVITGTGRLGLQAILFEFISENKHVYTLGDGSNKYQFADAIDVCSALEKASHIKGFDVYNIGADEVLSLKEIYQQIIKFAKSSSHIVQLPKASSLFLLSILDKLDISPLGVYQYTMIGRSLYTDTTKIKKKLGWKPKKTNLDTFIDNYIWYIQHKGNFTEIGSGDFSANKSLPKMGMLKIIKMFS